MQKKIIAAVAAASTLAGAAGGAAFLAPGAAGAQDATDTGTPTAAPVDEGGDTVRPDPGERLGRILQPLVDDGTLTDAQMQAVIERLESARPADGHRGGPGEGRGPGGFGQGLGTAVSDVLGLEPDALRDALMSGSTIADIAAAQNVPLDDVIAALVDQAEARLDAAVEAGRIDADRAAELSAEAADRAEALVNGDLPLGPRHRGPHHDADADGGD
jgi:hypothetical protein